MVSHKLRLSFQPRGLAVARGFILFSLEFQNLVVACVKTFYSQNFPSGCLSFHLRVSRFYTTCNPICCHIGRLLTLALELLPLTDITAINAINPMLPTMFVSMALIIVLVALASVLAGVKFAFTPARIWNPTTSTNATTTTFYYRKGFLSSTSYSFLQV